MDPVLHYKTKTEMNYKIEGEKRINKSEKNLIIRNFFTYCDRYI